MGLWVYGVQDEIDEAMAKHTTHQTLPRAPRLAPEAPMVTGRLMSNSAQQGRKQEADTALIIPETIHKWRYVSTCDERGIWAREKMTARTAKHTRGLIKPHTLNITSQPMITH